MTTTIACIGDMAVDVAVAVVVARIFVMLAMWKKSMSDAPPLPSWRGRARSSPKRKRVATTAGHGKQWRTGRRNFFFSYRPSWLLLALFPRSPYSTTTLDMRRFGGVHGRWGWGVLVLPTSTSTAGCRMPDAGRLWLTSKIAYVEVKREGLDLPAIISSFPAKFSRPFRHYFPPNFRHTLSLSLARIAVHIHLLATHHAPCHANFFLLLHLQPPMVLPTTAAASSN